MNNRLKNLLGNLDEHCSSKVTMVNLAIDDLSEVDLLKVNENDLAENLMKALITIDLFTLLKDSNKKQLVIYEKF